MRRFILSLFAIGGIAVVASAQMNRKPLENGGPLDQPPANPLVELRVDGLPPVPAIVSGRSGANDAVILRIRIQEPHVVISEKDTLKGRYTHVEVKNTERIVDTIVDYDAKSAIRGTEIYDLDGKRVDPATFLRMQKKGGTHALVSYTGLVDPIYLGAIKEGTFIIVLGPRDGAEGTVRKMFH